MPRSRAARAGKITRQSIALAAMQDNNWRKYMRCFVCKHLVCVNNYTDRKPRVRPEDKYMGKFLCATCRTKDPHTARQFIRMHCVLERVDRPAAQKVVREWAEYKIPKSQRHLGRY